MLFAKIFEKVLANRLVKFFQEFSVLSKNPHGFTENQGTETAVLDFLQNIILSVEKDAILTGLFVNSSRAFHCVEDQVFLRKLKKCDIKGNTTQTTRKLF